MGSVTVVISLLMMLLVFFDHPHGEGSGALQTDRHGADHPAHRQPDRGGRHDRDRPCDARGNPR